MIEDETYLQPKIRCLPAIPQQRVLSLVNIFRCLCCKLADQTSPTNVTAKLSDATS